MDVKKSLIATLSLVAITAVADPAPVADLSRSSNRSLPASPPDLVLLKNAYQP